MEEVDDDQGAEAPVRVGADHVRRGGRPDRPGRGVAQRGGAVSARRPPAATEAHRVLQSLVEEPPQGPYQRHRPAERDGPLPGAFVGDPVADPLVEVGGGAEEHPEEGAVVHHEHRPPPGTSAVGEDGRVRHAPERALLPQQREDRQHERLPGRRGEREGQVRRAAVVPAVGARAEDALLNRRAVQLPPPDGRQKALSAVVVDLAPEEVAHVLVPDRHPPPSVLVLEVHPLHALPGRGDPRRGPGAPPGAADLDRRAQQAEQPQDHPADLVAGHAEVLQGRERRQLRVEPHARPGQLLLCISLFRFFFFPRDLYPLDPIVRLSPATNCVNRPFGNAIVAIEYGIVEHPPPNRFCILFECPSHIPPAIVSRAYPTQPGPSFVHPTPGSIS